MVLFFQREDMKRSVHRQLNIRENARVSARYGIDGFTSTILQDPTAPRGAALSVAAPLPLAQPYPQPPSLALGKAQWVEGGSRSIMPWYWRVLSSIQPHTLTSLIMTLAVRDTSLIAPKYRS